MLTDLKFVMGAVAKKDLVPAMKHFNIKDGFVRSYNGMVGLCAPISCDIDCNPHAETMYRAIENCDEVVALSLTPGGKLSVKSGKFRALVPCIYETVEHPAPNGKEILIEDGKGLIQALKILEPIIGDDAARPWQAGVLLKNGSAYATCNIIAVEYWTNFDLGHVVNIPAAAVREILRVGEPPERLQVEANSITFHYESGRWIRTQLLPTDWPDFDKLLTPGLMCNHTEIEPALWEACERLRKFTEPKMGDAIYFENGEAFTHRDRECGSSFLCESVRWTGIYNRNMLMLIQPLAKTADFTHWPRPCYFFGERLRGAIVGRAA